MKKHNLAKTLLLVTQLVGCANAPIEAPKNITIEKAVCCQNYSQISWIPLTGDLIDMKIDSQSQIIEIDGDKSYIAAFSLPESVEQMEIKLSSWMRVKGVFAPKIMFLDAKFKPFSVLELDDFNITNGDILDLASYQIQFVLDREKTPYFIVYSPLSYRQGKVTIPHPERVRAEELGMARPMVTDPVIEHTNAGELELSFKALRLRAYRMDEMPTKQIKATAAKAKLPNAAIQKKAESISIQTNSQVAEISNSIMAETEAFYNQQIIQTVEQEDISKALQWLDEAKRAGSDSAESTFVDAVNAN